MVTEFVFFLFSVVDYDNCARLSVWTWTLWKCSAAKYIIYIIFFSLLLLFLLHVYYPLIDSTYSITSNCYIALIQFNWTESIWWLLDIYKLNLIKTFKSAKSGRMSNETKIYIYIYAVSIILALSIATKWYSVCLSTLLFFSFYLFLVCFI